MAAYQLCFFAAVVRTGVAVGTVVAIGSAPILAGGLGWLARGERPDRRWAAATALAVVGCGLLIGAGRTPFGREAHVDTLGVVLALGGGVAYASYAVASKGLLERISPDAATAAVFCLGALFLSPMLLIADLSWLAQPRGVAVALHLGLVATAAAYALFARGLRVVPVATAVTLSLAEPLTAASLGLLVLGERLTPPAIVGVALLLGGLVWLAVGRR
jgi:DME family drug/metabolite transporter